MPDILTPTDPDLHAANAPAPAAPSLALAWVLHACEGVRLARLVLPHTPVSGRESVAVEHLRRAEEYVLLAKEHLQQCVRAWIMPEEPPSPSGLTEEGQITIDEMLAARELPQP